jgi:hypothetical protein
VIVARALSRRRVEGGPSGAGEHGENGATNWAAQAHA